MSVTPIGFELLSRTNQVAGSKGASYPSRLGLMFVSVVLLPGLVLC